MPHFRKACCRASAICLDLWKRVSSGEHSMIVYGDHLEDLTVAAPVLSGTKVRNFDVMSALFVSVSAEHQLVRVDEDAELVLGAPQGTAMTGTLSASPTAVIQQSRRGGVT
jgi:hypothetical protein